MPDLNKPDKYYVPIWNSVPQIACYDCLFDYHNFPPVLQLEFGIHWPKFDYFTFDCQIQETNQDSYIQHSLNILFGSDPTFN